MSFDHKRKSSKWERGVHLCKNCHRPFATYDIEKRGKKIIKRCPYCKAAQ